MTESIAPLGQAAPSPIVAPVPHLAFDGRFGSFGRLVFGTNLLTLVTLGFYRFWATTRRRRYLWSHVALGGDRLEYTGTGRELFLGFLFGALVLGLSYGAFRILSVAAAGDGVAEIAVGVMGVFGLATLYMVAAFYQRRYLMSRSRWRGSGRPTA